MTSAMAPALAPEDEPEVVTVLNAAGTSPVVLVCEHASNFIPASYDGLGLSAADRQRHIAWDIGAAGVTRALSGLIDAPAFLAGWSRLLIDGNRPIGAPSSIPETSEATVIPGNRGLGAAERERRADRFFRPFHDRLSAFLDARRAAGKDTWLVAIHSFTPVFLGVARPWHAGILYGHSRDWGARLVAAFDSPDRPVAANEPYMIEAESDYLAPVHGEARGLPTVLFEIRQDLVATAAAEQDWARAIAALLTAVPPR